MLGDVNESWRKKRDRLIFKMLMIMVGVIVLITLIFFFKDTILMSLGVYNIDPRWGLGKHETAHSSCNRNYDWYIDKGNTGIYSKTNSGPACAVMAAKWANKNFDAKYDNDKYWGKNAVIDARKDCKDLGELWTHEDVENYLAKYKIDYDVCENVDEEIIKKNIDNGNILIFCMDSRYLENAPKKEKFFQKRIGKFYFGRSRYFIIVKGYRIVDDNLFFETYDPTSNYAKYYKGDFKGKDRYYRSSNFLYAVNKKWKGFILVKNKN
ncbi:hypothetical protein CLTEP_11350 [Clostridium tepidiprofundi DSM 19306]|uniref:Peptidase C39-like domain-containing protein n=1 Tax=Clostridium tepidiprofundi DSM 19306 TaxID=1121338 RepID=A0A151B4X9_9CLOT|nr:hypothetical protein [Clostridium tepidiprofundi]KYH34971.1 hypothetical protein CLTEP_11350 [Clostridium tepidiprofundi DSM 19306]